MVSVGRVKISVLKWPWLVLVEWRYLCWSDPGWCWLKHISLPGLGLTGPGSPAEPNVSWLSAEFKYISKCELSNHSAFSQRAACQHTSLAQQDRCQTLSISGLSDTWPVIIICLDQITAARNGCWPADWFRLVINNTKLGQLSLIQVLINETLEPI